VRPANTIGRWLDFLPFKECASAAFGKLLCNIKLILILRRIKWICIHAFYQGMTLK